MYARCPGCQTIFEVSDDIVNVRVGMVRCSICRVAFNASWNFVDQLPAVDLPPAVAHSTAAEPDVADTDAPTTYDVPLEAQPEPLIIEQATEPVEPGPVAAPAPVNAESLEVVGGAIELESESILKEVERLDDALARKQGSNQAIEHEQTTDVDLLKNEYGKQFIPDDEIVLETPADAWQHLDPDLRARPSAPDSERISTSVKRMRAMLDPVTESETDTEDGNGSVQAVEPSVVEKPGLRHGESPPEPHPLDGGGVEVAVGAAERSAFSQTYSGSEDDAAAMETGSSASAWRGVAWFIGIVTLLLLTLWQIREFYLGDLAQVPAIRPVLSEFCQIAACKVPPRRDSRLIDLVGTNVETHPAVPGALRVVVSLINRADYSQLPPLLEVTLSDTTGRVVGRRTYTPKDYVTSLDDANLEPNVVSNVTLDLATPSDSAVGYEIQLIPD